MKHDETEDLENQVRLELEEEKSLPKRPPLKFSDPSQLVKFLSNLPIKKDVELTALPPFLRRLRTNLNLEREDVATAVHIPTETLIELESSDFLPWTLPAAAMAALACAYRVHFEAVESLTENSYLIARLSKVLSNPESTKALMSQWLQEVQYKMGALGGEC